MPSNLVYSTRAQAQALTLLGIESIIIMLVSILLYFTSSLSYSYAFVMGGIASLLPNLFFAYAVFKENKASAAKRIVIRFYLNEFIKLTLMAILFVIFVRFLSLKLLPFILGFLVAQVGIWFTPLLFFKKTMR